MKKIIIIFVIVIGVVGIVFWILPALNQPCTTIPTRLEQIPSTAFWKGDCDEGFWFEIVSIEKKSSLIRIRVYNDYEGKLALDANFKVSNECSELLQVEALKENIITYEELTILTKFHDCNLGIVPPAYGGYLWEIEKEMN